MSAEGVVTIGGPPGQLRATLTIQGLDLEPDDISGRLKCLPNDSQRRGQPRKRGAPYKHGAWSITEVSDGQESASQLVELLLDRLPADSDVWDEFRPVYQVSLDLYVYLTTENQDFVLSAEQVGRLSKMAQASGSTCMLEAKTDGVGIILNGDRFSASFWAAVREPRRAQRGMREPAVGTWHRNRPTRPRCLVG